MNRLFYISLLIILTLSISSYADETETVSLSDVHITAPGDHFSKLSERYLIERPNTETPKLEITTSAVGRPEIEEKI